MVNNLLRALILLCLAQGAFALDMCLPSDNQVSMAATSTFFDSGGAGGNYGNGENCSVLIQPAGGGTITLTFSAFETRNGQDSLVIYDGTDTSGIPLGTFFGNLATPFAVSATSGAMFIEWSTNPGGNDPGWQASWSTVAAPPLAPTVQWRMDELQWDGTSGEVVDSISGFNGTAFNATTTTGLVCNAGDFSANGTTDYLSMEAAALDGLTDFTISVWGKTSNSGNQAIFSGSTGSQHNELIFWLPNATTFTPYLKGSGSGSIGISNISDDQWHHLVWTRDGAQNCIYVDSALQGCSTKSAAALNIAAGGLIIGQEQDSFGGGFSGSQDWEGLLDEPLIFDQALAQAEVTSIYTNQLAGDEWDGSARSCPVAVIPLAEWRMEEFSWDGTAGEVVDESGNGYDATAVNGANTDDTSPAIGGNPGTCRYGEFDDAGAASGNYLEVGGFPNLTSDFTMMGWIRTQDNARSGQRIFQDDQSNSGGYALSLGDGGPGTLRFYARAVSPVSLDTGNLIQNNQWYFVAAVADITSGVRTIYVFDSTATLVAPPVTGSFSGSWGTDTGPATIGGETNSGEANNRFLGNLDEVRVYSQVLDEAALQLIAAETHPCPMILAPTVEWRFDESGWDGTAGEVVDSIGGFNGTAFNATTTGGLVCNAADLTANATTDYLSLDRGALNGATDFTLSVWGKTSVSGTQTLFSGSTGSQHNELIMFFPNATTFTPYIKGSGSGSITIPSIADDQWHHFAWTRSGSQNCLYVDSVLRGCATRSTAALSIANGGLIIGQEQDSLGGGFSGGQDWEGLVDEPLVFAQALAQADVTGIYNNQLAGNGWDGTPRPCAGPLIDHYSIAHDGSGVTCLTENITITAHDSSHTAVAPGAVNLSLSTSSLKGSWVGKVSGGGTLVDPAAGDGAASYNIPAGETGVVLRFNYPNISAGTSETFSFGVTDGGFSETSGVATTALDDPSLTVSLVGLDFTNVATQISGKDSNVAPSSSISLRAVRASDSDPSVCDTLLASQSLNVELGAECRDPAICNGGQTRVNSTLITTSDDNGGAQSSAYGTVNLAFDAAGDADLVVNYTDAGQVQLHARLNIPLDDGSGLPSGDYALGSSNNFVVKPAGLCVESADANADCASGDASCSLFKRAGEVFNLTVSGVDWQAASEADTDFCSGNNVTPNFRLSNIALTPNLVAPSPGTNTSLGDLALDIVAADMGSHTTATQSSSEVGVFTLTATPPPYLGETITASTSANIGRFYPDRFELSLGAVAEACATGVFTYLDQDFSVDYRLTALNTGGITTANYRNDFIKLNPVLGTVTYGAVDTGAAITLTGRLANSANAFNWNNDGTGDLAADLNLARQAAPDGPFAADIGVIPSDDDGVTIAAIELDLDVDIDASNDHGLIGQTTQRYGRLFIDNAFGPEVLALSMPVEAEFWSGTAFVVNMMDSCTTLTDAPAPGGVPADPDSWGDFELSAYTDSLAPGDSIPGYSAMVNGIGVLDLSAPGAGNSGAVRIDVRGPAWLRFDYDANPVTPVEDTHAEATFGQFRGNDRVIYWRELIPVQ